MLKKLFKKLFGGSDAQSEAESGLFIIAQLNDKVMPIYRGEFYEDPLNDFLQKEGYGEITGGGTMQAESGEIKFCDIEILIYKDQDINKITSEIIRFLEELGVPKGSFLTVEETNEQIPFGKAEGLAIYLDGVNLPDNVYKECNSNFVLSELSRLVGYNGKIPRYWEGRTGTALYFYGESFSNMNHAISEFVSTYPLCERARIIQIA